MQQIMFALVGLVGAALLTAGLLEAHADSGLDKGLNLAERGDIRGALAAYKAAVEANPEWAEAHARLGGMQLISQHYADAVQSFQAAIRLGGEGARAFVGMGMAYLHMGQYQAARAALLEAKAHGVRRSEDVDQVLVWLDRRSHPARRPATH